MPAGGEEVVVVEQMWWLVVRIDATRAGLWLDCGLRAELEEPGT